MVTFNLSTLLDELAGRELVLGFFMIGAGLAFMLLGTRIFKTLVSLSLGVIGFVLGGLIQTTPQMQLIYGLGIALVLAIFGAYFSKAAVSALSGGWAAMIMMSIADGFIHEESLVAVIGVCGFASAVSLVLIMYKECIACLTSFEGAILALCGLVVFISHHGASWIHLRTLLIDTPIFAPFAVVAVTVTGFYLQLASMRQEESGVTA
jgi:hypothetical protein